MLKPNYRKKEIDRNYKISLNYSNDYFGYKGTRGINELQVNGYTVRFIPYYNKDKVSQNLTEKYIRNNNFEPKNMDESRAFSFYYADLIFYENSMDAGKSYKMQYYFDNPNNPQEEEFCLIHCIDSSTFQKLSKEMRKIMPYVLDDRKLNHHLRREHITDLKFVQYLDEKFLELKDLLPTDFRKSLEL